MAKANQSKMEKARRDYSCVLCGRMIPKGSLHWYNHELDEDEMISFRAHTGCLYKLEQMRAKFDEMDYQIDKMAEEFIGAPPEVVTEDGLFIREAGEFYG